MQLHVAAANGYHEITRLLVDAGAHVDITDGMGYTPLHVAAKFNQVASKHLAIDLEFLPQLHAP